MRAIKIISTILVLIFWLVMSAFCGYNLLWGGNDLKVILTMTSCIIYGSQALWLLYGFNGKKYNTVLHWVAFGLALLPIVLLVTIFYMLSDVDVDSGRLLMH